VPVWNQHPMIGTIAKTCPAVGALCDTGLVRPLNPRLMRYASGVRTLLVVSVLVGAVNALVVVAQAVLLAGVLADVIIGGQSLSDVRDRLVWLAVVIAIRAALAWSAEEIAGRSAGSVTVKLRRDVLRHAAGLGPRWRSGEHGGELSVLATTGIESLHDYIARYLPQLVLSVVVPVIMLGYLFTADLTSGIIVLITLPLIPVFMALVGWYTDKQTKAKWYSLSRLAAHFTDVVAGLPTLKVFGRAKAQAAAVRRVTDDYRRASMATLRVAFLSSMVLELLASLSVALVAVAIGLRLVYGELTLQVGLAVLILAPEAYLPLRALGTQFHAAADGVAATAKVLAILETPLPARGVITDLPALPAIRLVDVRLGVAGERGSVGPLSLSVPAGLVTVVTGDSGVGKTTLLQILAGVQRPDSGQVLVGDGRAVPGDAQPVKNQSGTLDPAERQPVEVELADIDPTAWGSQVAWAGQGAALQAGSIRDNLALGNPAVDDSVLRAALEAVDAAGFVDALPGGWHTELGAGGAGISQGQRQRLALARALSRPAPLVLLDEPTAALDEQTESRVLAGIATALRGRTVVLVTHRPAPVALADRVITLAAVDEPVQDEPGVAQAEADGAEPLAAVGPW
jgi:ATP-binding cassette subfamily C protein CydD